MSSLIRTYVSPFANEVLSLFVEMAPYLVVGFAVAGVLSVVLSKDVVSRHIGHPGFASVLKASILGVPLPLCSCGVVPAATYLRRAGASKPAVMSFLISTPQTGVDNVVATYGMLGPLFAVFRPIAAFVTGIAGGALSLLGERRPGAEGGGGSEARRGEVAALRQDGGKRHPEGGAGLWGKLRAAFRFAFVESIDDLAGHFLIGLLISGLIAVFVPEDFFVGRAIGSGLPAMLLMVAVGIPMYVCSTSSIPIVVALIAKGLSPGAAYVFLVAGPATNAATIAILVKTLGVRSTVVYVATLIAGSLVFGPVMEALSGLVGWAMPEGSAGGSAHLLEETSLLSTLLAGALAVLIVVSFVRRLMVWQSQRAAAKRGASEWGGDGLAGETAVGDTTTGGETTAGQTVDLTVTGMTCSHCVATVRDATLEVPGVRDVRVDLSTGMVRVLGDDRGVVAEVSAAIRRAGYETADVGEGERGAISANARL